MAPHSPAPFELSPLVRSIPENPLRALYPYAARAGMLNLAGGHPSRDAYDLEGLAQASAQAAADFSAWTYGPSAGDPQLVEALAPLSPSHPAGHKLVITSGAQQAVDLTLRSLCSPGDTVALPEPVYPAILSICAAAGLKVVPYQIYPDDLTCRELGNTFGRQRIAALYAQPTFSNPGGETWSLALRENFLTLCAAHNVPVVEDDPYRALCFSAPPPPALVALSTNIQNSTVIWAGSLSKMLSPGLRLGWTLVPELLAKPMTDLRQADDLQPNALAQRVALRYLERGRLDLHLTRVRALYQARRDRLAEILARANFDFELPEGGMFLFAALPEGRSHKGLFERAVSRDVVFAPGSAFTLDRDAEGCTQHLRLCFAGLDADTLGVAAERLIAALKD